MVRPNVVRIRNQKTKVVQKAKRQK